MNATEIESLDLGKKLTIKELIKAAFQIYELNPTGDFIDRYVDFFSWAGEYELENAINNHISNDAHNPQAHEIISKIINSQRMPDGEMLH